MIPLIDSGRDDWIYITGSVLLLSFPSNKLGKYISQVLTLLKYHIVTQQGWFFLQGKKTFTSSAIAQEKVKVCSFHEALTNLLVKVLLSFIVTTFCAQIGSESNVLWVPAFLEINEMDRTTCSVLMSSSSMQQGGFYTLTSSIRRWVHFGTLMVKSVINQLNQLTPNIWKLNTSLPMVLMLPKLTSRFESIRIE